MEGDPRVQHGVPVLGPAGCVIVGRWPLACSLEYADAWGTTGQERAADDLGREGGLSLRPGHLRPG
jgi:hypothetical protein